MTDRETLLRTADAYPCTCPEVFCGRVEHQRAFLAGHAPEGNGKAPPAVVTPVVQRLADVVAERVDWLWPGRIPLAKLTVLDGDPGLGKSTLTLDLAARLSTGGTMPDGHRLPEAAGVVLLTAEDGLADTVKPRLDAASADCARIVALTDVRDGTEPVPVSLPAHLPALRVAVEQVAARLVIVDPLMAFLGSTVDSWRDQDIRRALRPLVTMAEETGAAVLVIRHLTKRPGGQAIYRGGGSIGIVGAARSGLVVARDPADDGSVVLAASKSNLCAPPPSLRYQLVSEGPHGVARVEWLGASQHTADQLMAGPADPDERSAIDTAVAFLQDALDDGPKPVREVIRDARAEGIAPRTLDRARAQLGVRSVPSGFGGPRTLTLPDSSVSAKNPSVRQARALAETERFGGDCSESECPEVSERKALQAGA
jgi:hypothetical protein